MAKTKYPPCCSKHDLKALKFVDQSSELDKHLYMLAQLCFGVTNFEVIDPEIITLVGNALTELLERRICLEHFFWGREIGVYPIDEARIEAELAFLKLRVRD